MGLEKDRTSFVLSLTIIFWRLFMNGKSSQPLNLSRMMSEWVHGKIVFYNIELLFSVYSHFLLENLEFSGGSMSERKILSLSHNMGTSSLFAFFAK